MRMCGKVNPQKGIMPVETLEVTHTGRGSMQALDEFITV